jgi:multisubunit Na+/H+ antiporter MnhB subunit
MIDWLMASLDPSRPHVIDVAAAWHGRLMVLAWAVLLPLGVIVARFCKVTPRQKWPDELDSKLWWYAHQGLQYLAGTFLLLALILIWRPREFGSAWHVWFGWIVIAASAAQFLSAWLRGTKGGPTDPRPDGSLAGDHYDMTQRRRLFEHLHKSIGYIALGLSIAAIGSGLWLVNAPRWMPLALGLWWLALIALWTHQQRRGRAIDTYQAIWGPDPKHPGNAVPPTGWGVRRIGPELHEHHD